MLWDDSVTVDLATHMSQVLILLKRAEGVWYEHDYYHPYNFALNFNALRKSSKKNLFYSVYPQARISWQLPSDSVPDEKLDKTDKSLDDGTFYLPISYYTNMLPQTHTGKNVDNATKSIDQLDLTQTTNTPGPSTTLALNRTVTTRCKQLLCSPETLLLGILTELLFFSYDTRKSSAHSSTRFNKYGSIRHCRCRRTG